MFKKSHDKILYNIISFFFDGLRWKTWKKQHELRNSVKPIEGEYAWTKLLDSADWRESYNFQMFSIKDTLWIFHFDGNWYSVDGK
ncbi:MAG: hypothetical protein ACM3VS_18650 [Candidatus Dadabacteria bacterium]